MNITRERKNFFAISIAIIVMILIGVIIPYGVVGGILYFDIIQVLPAIAAIISFFLAIILSIRQKHISFYTIGAAIIGVLFLASSVILFGYSTSLELYINAQYKYSRIMQPEQISLGLAFMGMGLAFLEIMFGGIKLGQVLKAKNQASNWSKFFVIAVSIFIFAFGIYSLANGLLGL